MRGALGRITRFIWLLQPLKMGSTTHIHCSCWARHTCGFRLAMLALTRPTEAPRLLRMHKTAACWAMSSLSCAPTRYICRTPLRASCTACSMFASQSTSHHCVSCQHRPGKDTQEYSTILAKVGIRPAWLQQNFGRTQAWTTMGKSCRGSEVSGQVRIEKMRDHAPHLSCLVLMCSCSVRRRPLLKSEIRGQCAIRTW